MNQANLYIPLIIKKLQGTISSSENAQLTEWIEHSLDNQTVVEQYTRIWNGIQDPAQLLSVDHSIAWNSLQAKIITAEKQQTVEPTKRLKTPKAWLFIGSSAVILLSGTLWYLFSQEKEHSISDEQKVNILIKTDTIVSHQKTVPFQEREASYGFSFKDTPLADVVSTLEKEFHVVITVKRKENEECRYSGSFKPNTSLEELLHVITSTMDLTYHKTNDGYIIEGPLCKD